MSYDETLYPLILNSSSLVNDNNKSNKYRYSFPTGSVSFNNSKVAVSNINIYYSWFNITASANNNSYQIIHPTLAGSTTLTITMPDGFYDIASINSYLQQELISNSFYLLNASGDYVYYAEFVSNANYYAIQYNAYEVPTALPAGWSNPAGMTFPAAAARPQLVVLANSFTDIIGFTAATYPAVLAGNNYSVLSSYTPQITPIQSLILSCTLLNNRYSNPSTILYSFTPGGATFGNLIESSPNQLSFVDIVDGNYNFFEVRFLDQDFNDVELNDSNLVIQLLIKTKDVHERLRSI